MVACPPLFAPSASGIPRQGRPFLLPRRPPEGGIPGAGQSCATAPRQKRTNAPRAGAEKNAACSPRQRTASGPPNRGAALFCPKTREPGAVRAKPAGPQRVRRAAAAQGTKSGLFPLSPLFRDPPGRVGVFRGRPPHASPRFPSKGRRRDVISGWNGQRFRVRMAMMIISEKKNRTAQHATPSARIRGFECLDSGKQLHTFR